MLCAQAEQLQLCSACSAGDSALYALKLYSLAASAPAPFLPEKSVPVAATFSLS